MIIIWRIIPWWLTDHHNCQSFKLFSLWQSHHAVCHCQESGKTATHHCNALVLLNLQYRPVRREERGMFILHHFLLIDVYASFFWRQSPTAGHNDPGWETDLFLLKSDVNLFNHLVRKVTLRVVVLRVLFFRRRLRLPRIQCRWFVLSESCFLR